MKRTLTVLGAVFLVLLVLGGIVAAVVVFSPGTVRKVVEGETRLLDYLGEQVVGIANSHLVPELSFESIRYEPPYTLTLGGVGLVAPDATRVLDLGGMTVTLAQTPRIGEPLQIERLTLSNGAVRLIRDPAGGFRGLSPLVEPREERERTATEFRLSEVLVLNRLVVEGIDLVYDAGDGSEPMRLDALAADLRVEPVADAGPGWYALALTSGREPGLELALDGRLNIESFDLAINELTAEAMLDDRTATTLPPQLATLLTRHQVRGAMRARASGVVPLMAPAGSELYLDLSLDRGRAVFGEYQVPLDTVDLRADMAAGVVEIGSFEVSALGGRTVVTGRLDLDGDAVVSWDTSGLDLREMLASRPADAPPKMAGRVTTTGSLRAPLSEPMAGLSGAGQIDVREGRLVNLPVLSDLLRVMEVAGLTTARTTDTFSSPLVFDPRGVGLQGFELRTGTIAARGSGTIGFDGSLDLSVNGGPLESIQNRLGAFGSVLGRITDQLVAYRVGGSVSEPKVSVQPLGIGG